MGLIYVVFAAIPVIALIAVFFPEITGRREAIPAGGFEYCVYLSKKWLMIGSVLISVTGIIFMLTLENISLLGWIGVFLLVFMLLCMAVSLLIMIFYLGYRLTVRGGTLFFKLPGRRELILPVSNVTAYSIFQKKNGSGTLLIYVGKHIAVFAESGSPGFELLCEELKARGIPQK